jgi:hypothetical protein
MKHYKLYLWGLVGFVVFALLFFAAMGVAIYKFNYDGKLARGLCRLIPCPVARVGWHFIKYSDFWSDLDSLNYFYNSQKDQAGLPVPDLKSLKQNVLNRLEENYALESLAKEKGVVVSKADIEADYKTISDENNGEENLKKLLKDYYNWTPEIFKNRVIYYSLLGEKLTEAMGGEDKLSAELENRTLDEKVRKYISF